MQNEAGAYALDTSDVPPLESFSSPTLLLNSVLMLPHGGHFVNPATLTHASSP